MKILHLEDNLNDAELAHELLATEWPDCIIKRTDNRDGCLAAMEDNGYDLVLSDFSMVSFTGLEALELVKKRLPTVPFIFFSGTIGEERAIEAVRAGALDYVLKDHIQRLVPAVRRALRDNAERRRREHAEAGVREYADIIDRAAESIIVTDLDGRITRWNRGAENLFGVAAAAAAGHTLDELFPQAIAMLHQLRSLREPILTATGEWKGEIAFPTRDGQERIVELHTTLIRDDAGQPKARLTIASDITEKRRLEKQFLHAQRLESLGLLAAGIAHDLNNVLAPVLMAAPLLRMRATDPTDIRTIEILEKSAERGSGLVRQILGFAQGARGGLQLLQVKHLIRDISEVVAASFPKSIALEDYVPTDLWPVQANPTQVHQILLNLCVNARDAMLPRGGTLLLRAENRRLDEAAAHAIEGARAGAFLVLEVSDTGTGIPPDVLARIWEPFFTTKGEGKGTGLGLSTVRGVVANHSGFIELVTAAGRGTTFRVFLPADTTHQVGPIAGQKNTIPRGSGQLVLIVDDESTVRDLTAAILTNYGYRVVLGGDGVEALALFTRHRDEIRLVITDINMPNLDGNALALVLNRLQPGIKIMAITGLGSSNATELREFAAAILQKPFAVDELLRTVHRLVATETASRA